jgi:phosphoglycerate dehydrogenase-like enzyme
MKSISQPHHLLIVSQNSAEYQQLIEREKLSGLSITAIREPNRVEFTANRYDIVFGEPSLVGRMLNQLPDLKWVQSSWAGIEPLLTPDLKRDYILTNIRNVYGSMMSEFVFGYLLMIERQIIPRWQSQLKGEWDPRPYSNLCGKVIGLLGVGTIGAHLAATGKHFGMKVFGYTRQSEDCRAVNRYFHGESWHDFASKLDYLVCCLPGTTATRGIVDGDAIAALPRKAWLVNVGRGSTVDDAALVNALNNGLLSGAVLDVFNEEPLPKGHPLWTTPNTFITFHSAAKNIPADIVKVFIINYKRYIHGEGLLYQVNFDLGY